MTSQRAWAVATCAGGAGCEPALIVQEGPDDIDEAAGEWITAGPAGSVVSAEETAQQGSHHVRLDHVSLPRQRYPVGIGKGGRDNIGGRCEEALGRLTGSVSVSGVTGRDEHRLRDRREAIDRWRPVQGGVVGEVCARDCRPGQ